MTFSLECSGLTTPTELIGLFLIGAMNVEGERHEREGAGNMADYDRNTLYPYMKIFLVPGLFPQFHPHK